MRRRLFVLTLLGGAVLSAPALARPCAPSDVAGLWELRSITAAEPGVQAFYKRTPHEYLSITPAMNFSYLAGPKRLKPNEAEQVLAAASQAVTAIYTVNFPKPGVLVVLRDAQRPIQAVTCNIAERPEAGAVVGDMIWTELPGMPALRRVHRQLKPPVAAPFFLLGASTTASVMHGMDIRTVRRSGEKAAFDVNAAHSRPAPGEPDYVTMRVEADCATRKYKIASIQQFTAGGVAAGPPSTPTAAWEGAETGAIAEALTLACTGKPSLKQTIPVPSLERAILAYRAMARSGQLN